MCASLAGSERQRGGGGGGGGVLKKKKTEQSLVAWAENELNKPWGGFESDSSRAIREVKQLIIT